MQLGRPQKKASPSEATDGPRIYFETYGCQMNVADTAMMNGLLKDNGFRKSKSPENADVVIINTCAVRERAEDKVRARAQELGSIIKRRPDTVLAVVGCMAEHLREGLFAESPNVDIVAGPDSYRRLPQLIRSSLEGDTKNIDVNLDKHETYEGLGATEGDGVSGFVTIQRGCDKFCTFCVVPFTRGRERGVAPREVLRRVRQFAEAGYREVVLLGQTVNSYRYEDVDFADLLNAVTEIDGIDRIRFTSPYPVDFSDKVIDTIGRHKKICKYLHLPVQSGSNVVLERMRRGYSRENFLTLVEKIRNRVPEMALSTDILSGFSGETEDDHQETLSLMRQVRFDSAFMFSYSERSLTFAAKKLPDDVPTDVKKRRLKEIIDLQSSISKDVFAQHVGTKQQVLIHSTSKKNESEWVGRTDGFKSVILPKENYKVGDIAPVTIARSTMATLFASP